jgi:acetoin utilization protein AcuB
MPVVLLRTSTVRSSRHPRPWRAPCAEAKNLLLRAKSHGQEWLDSPMWSDGPRVAAVTHSEEAMTRACDLMTENPTTVSPLATVREAARLLHALDVRHLPVVDDEGTLVGMISDRDVRNVGAPLLVDGQEKDRQGALDTTVGDLMSSDVLSVELDDEVTDIVELMLEHKVGAIPVVDGDGALAGIVSYIDLLRGAQL